MTSDGYMQTRPGTERRITREDIEAKFAQLRGTTSSTTSRRASRARRHWGSRPSCWSSSPYVLGRRRGRKRRTIVEIRYACESARRGSRVYRVAPRPARRLAAVAHRRHHRRRASSLCGACSPRSPRWCTRRSSSPGEARSAHDPGGSRGERGACTVSTAGSLGGRESAAAQPAARSRGAGTADGVGVARTSRAQPGVGAGHPGRHARHPRRAGLPMPTSSRSARRRRGARREVPRAAGSRPSSTSGVTTRRSARTHFLRHCRDQVRRAIDDLEMIQAGDRVLVAVSGGKDSLALVGRPRGPRVRPPTASISGSGSGSTPTSRAARRAGVRP